MKFIVNEHMVLLRASAGSLAPYIVPFSEWVIGQGYAQCSLRQRVRIAADFSRWLAAKSVPLNGVSYQHTAQYLRYRAQRQRVCEGGATALQQLLDFLRTQGATPAEKPRQRQLSPAERCAQEYERYLREERVLAKATVVNYVPFARDFLKDCFGSGPVRLSRLRAGNVVRFVQRRAPQLHLKTAKLLTTALRSFLRYGRYRGDIQLDLASAVPLVANWSMSMVPRAIEPDQVRRHCHGNWVWQPGPRRTTVRG